MGRNYGIKTYEEQEEDKRIEKWVGVFLGVVGTCLTGLVIFVAWVFVF